MNHLLKYQIDLNDGTFGRGMANAQNQTRTLDQMVKRVGATIAGAFAVSSLATFGKQAVQTSADMEGLNNSIKFASKSEQEGAKNLQYLNDLTSKHGSNLMAATRGYKTFLGSMQDVPYTMNQIRKMYEQVDVANRVMNLSADDSQGVYLALGQIMSKGKVQAEELRGQIGERIPGAFAIAARAMGVSQAKLNKMMDDGELMSEDFLPRFAAELERTFGAGLEKSTNSFQSQSNRRQNAITQETAAIGTKLQPAYLTLQDMQIKSLQVGNGLITFYNNHNQVINTGVAILASYAVASRVVTTATALLTAGTALNTKVMVLSSGAMVTLRTAALAAATSSNILTGAWAALSVVMAANPIGLAITGVAILAAGIWAWNSSTEEAVTQNEDLTKSIDGTVGAMNAEFRVLKSLNPKSEERKRLVTDINNKYGEYLPKLLTEKSSLQDIAKAQSLANKEFEKGLFLKDMNKELDGYDKRLAIFAERLYNNKIEFARLEEVRGPGTFEAAKRMNEIRAENIEYEKMVKGYGILRDKAYKKNESLAAKLGYKLGGKKGDETSFSASESVSSSKSIRNVTVNIKSLVERIEVVMQGVKDGTSMIDVKRQMTDALVAVVRDAELAL